MNGTRRTDPQWIERACPMCGRNFLITNIDLWVFRRDFPVGRRKYQRFTFCSYGCTRKAEKEVEHKGIFKPKT